jgi:hypothetical protein
MKLLTLTATAVLVAVAGCSSAPRETYDRRAYEERERREKQVESSIRQAPKWMSQLPTSNNAVYANGTSVSLDMSMADWKAKMLALGKICVAAGGEVSQQGKIFIQDSSDTSVEISEMAIKTLCPSVDVTGAEVKEIMRVSEGSRFRTYILMALPVGDANPLQKRKDVREQQRRAVDRNRESFRELDQQIQQRQQPR